MGKLGLSAFAGAMMYVGATVTWMPFHSTLYPYSISQPSSFRHYVIQVAPSQNSDYFYPSVGSSTTNVNVSAVAGHDLPNEVTYLRSLSGKDVHKSGTIPINGHKMTVTCADFKTVTSPFRIEQVAFVADGFIWRLTASYDLRFKSMRSMMLRMLRSFKLQGPPPPPRHP